MKPVTLFVPYLGYRYGVFLGVVEHYKHLIELPNGKIIHLYDDEFLFD